MTYNLGKQTIDSDTNHKQLNYDYSENKFKKFTISCGKQLTEMNSIKV